MAGGALSGHPGRRSWPALGATALLLAACSHHVPPALAGTAQVRPADVTTHALTNGGYHNETAVAIDPARAGQVITAYQVPATEAHTGDDGATWRSAVLPGARRFELSGDPAVLVDADGHAYALFIAFDRPADYDTLGRLAHRNGIFLDRSDDGGVTWLPHTTAVIEQPERPGVPFEDKPMMAVDRSRDPSRRGHLYVAWTEFRRHESVILFSRSVDSGRTFSPPLEISTAAGSPKDTVGADEGTSLAVARDGTIFVVWSDSTGIILDRSSDGGVTFGPVRRIARTPDIVFGIPGVARANGYPDLAIDPRSDRLYVEWVDRRFGTATPLLSTSNDAGSSWSAPRPVAGGPGDADDRFFAALAVDPHTGLVVSSFYRTVSNHQLEYDLATSTDGGATFAVRPWSAHPFPINGEFLGDYTGLDVFDGVAYGAWAESATAASPLASRLAHRGTRVVAGRARILAP